MSSPTGTGSTGSGVELTPLGLFLVTIRLPDEPQTDPIPDPAATTFQGLNMVGDGQLNMQPFPE